MRLAHVQIIASTSLGLVAGWGLPQPWRTYLLSGKQRVLGLQDENHEKQRWSSPPEYLLGDSESDHHRPRVGFVALGDSYSAGIGTGVEGKETNCRRGLGAYPQLIATDLAASHGGPNRTSFQFLSCTGARTEDILSSKNGGRHGSGHTAKSHHQIDALNASRPVDFALLTVGGNDLGFFDVMNACIFRFYNFYSGTCETALARAQSRLDAPDFDERLHILITELLDKLRWERKSPNFHITVTGYARFFNDRTEPCDDMSLGIWLGPSRGGPKLARPLRRRMNEMVRAVNGKIAAAVARINRQFTRDKVLFVDYDAAFEGHRFCEPGAAEPDYGRNETWFFLLNPSNVEGDGEAALSGPIDPTTCLPPAQRSGDWGELALCYMAMSVAEDPTLRLARGGGTIRPQKSGWHAPTYYAKTFHPRSLGHEAIRDRIYEVWSQQTDFKLSMSKYAFHH
ncbi:hypothetical protein PG984_013753 [Apiospora sp. TS-2023a]